MSKPLKPNPSKYIQQLAAWEIRLAEALGLDPSALLDIDMDDQDGAAIVKWRGVNQDAPKLGKVGAWGISSDGEFTEFFGHAILAEKDALALRSAAGPKPTPPEEVVLRSM